MTPRYYILVGKDPVRATLMEWARWFEESLSTRHRHVGNTTKNGVQVSTVFIGLDHNFLDDGPPLIFETMIFGGDHDGDCWRYSTYAAAELGHRRACRLAHGPPLKAVGKS